MNEHTNNNWPTPPSMSWQETARDFARELRESITRAGTVAWQWARVQQIVAACWVDGRAELNYRVGRSIADMGEHLTDSTRSLARRLAARVAVARRVLVAVAVLVGVLLAPAFAAWRPYAQLQHRLGNRLDESRLHGTGGQGVHLLATSPAVSLVLFLIAAGIVARAMASMAADSRYGFFVPERRIVLGIAAIASAVGIGRPLAQLGDRIVVGSGTAIGFIGAGVVLSAWRFFASATHAQAAMISRLNNHRARAELAAEQAEALTPATVQTIVNDELAGPGGPLAGAHLMNVHTDSEGNLVGELDTTRIVPRQSRGWSYNGAVWMHIRRTVPAIAAVLGIDRSRVLVLPQDSDRAPGVLELRIRCPKVAAAV